MNITTGTIHQEALPLRTGRGSAFYPAGSIAEITRLLGRYAPISLDAMGAVALQNRVDTKYVFTVDRLARILTLLPEQYRVLDIAGTRLSPYQTLYFDTADFQMYRRHHDERPDRYKLRSRRYLATDRSFLELKHKTPSKRTLKQRIETDAFVTSLPDDIGPLATELTIDPRTLEPKLWNSFLRITLVNLLYAERVTLDLDLRFHSDNDSVTLPGLVIAEVKQSGVNRQSAFVRQMRAAGIHPVSFSKYCIGVALLYPGIKHNTFKPTLQHVGALLRELHQ